MSTRTGCSGHVVRDVRPCAGGSVQSCPGVPKAPLWRASVRGFVHGGLHKQIPHIGLIFRK
jgi:hypothetical protein